MTTRFFSFLRLGMLCLPLWAVLSANAAGLRSEGIIESTTGGFRFPDGSTQTSAAATGSCSAGQFITTVNPDGSLECASVYDFLSLPPTLSTVDDPANNVGVYSSLAIGDDGLPVIGYFDVTAKALKVAKCHNTACTTASITTVDNPANAVGWYTSLAIGDDGLPVISYHDAGDDALKVAKCDDAACTTASLTTVDDPANTVGWYTSLAIGNDGLPVISYYDATAGALKVAKCDDAACTSASITTVDDPANTVGWYTSLAIGNDGLPVISYYDATAGALKVAKCDDAACTSASLTTVDDPANTVGAYSSLAIGNDGLPVISYDDATADALKVAKCGDATCTSASLTTVDAPANTVSAYSSLAIGNDGLPVISYFDATAHALKVAKCDDATCTSASLTTVDAPANTVGQYTSLAIGNDGLPVISYYDATADALKVAKCGKPACD